MLLFPESDLFLISREEDIGDSISLEYLGTCILRILFFSFDIFRERFFQERCFTQYSWQEAYDAIDPYQCS